MRMLDLYCGRLGVGRVFAERGWDVVGVDLVEPPEVPDGVTFVQRNALEIDAEFMRGFDFGWASSPCEEFSVHGMKCFHPNPKFPDMGLVLFCWTRRQFELSGIPFVMENVRPAQSFVGDAQHHCGPFYLWGNAVPPLMPQGIRKGANLRGKLYSDLTAGRIDRETFIVERKKVFIEWGSHGSKKREQHTANLATIPSELASTVADYAEALLGTKV